MVAGRPSNIISLKSLPIRRDGSAPQLVRPPPTFDPENNGFSRIPPAGKGEGLGSKFPSRSGGNVFGAQLGGRRPPAFGGARRNDGRPAGGRFGARPGGWLGGTPKGKKGMARRKNRDRKEKEKDETVPPPLNEATKAYIRELEMGIDIPYKPSFTPSSLTGFGPAVATNTPTGLHEIAVRNMRLLAGGRPHSEGEQTFELLDMTRWIRGQKPIYFSSIEQKEGMVKTLQGSRKNPKPIVETKLFEKLMKRLKRKHGDNYGAFVDAFNAKFDPVTLRQELDAAQEKNVWQAITGHSGTVKEAIAKYALKGEHPPIQYAEKTYDRLAMYHARGSTYRPADGAKFDAKVQTLVAS